MPVVAQIKSVQLTDAASEKLTHKAYTILQDKYMGKGAVDREILFPAVIGVDLADAVKKCAALIRDEHRNSYDHTVLEFRIAYCEMNNNQFWMRSLRSENVNWWKVAEYLKD